MNYRPFVMLIAIGVLFLFSRQVPETARLFGLINWVTEPVLATETSASRESINFFKLFATLRQLAQENAELRSRNLELEAQLTQLKEVEHTNAILRQELNFVQGNQDDYLPAQLIGRTATGLHKDLVINRGQGDGVATGQPVLAQGHLVGVVSATQSQQATVRLITHQRSLVPVILQDSRSTGLLQGGIGGLNLTDILIDATVNAGEAVVTSGLGGELPAGLPIGKVVATQAKKGDITKSATVSWPIDPTKLELVFVRKSQ